MTGLSRADRARAGLIRIRQEAQRERMDKYTALRDGGTLPADAAREVGLSSPTLYERSYRELRGISPRAQWYPYAPGAASPQEVFPS